MAKDLDYWKRLFEKRKPQTEELADRVKDKLAYNLMEGVLRLCETYSVRAIHSLPPQTSLFRKSFRKLKEIGYIDGMNMETLKITHPTLYYEFVGSDLFAAVYDKKNSFDFLKF